MTNPESVGDKRPVWPHKTPEDLARWILGTRITHIDYGWEFTGPDTSRDWLTLTNDKGESHQVDAYFLTEPSEFIFRPSSHGLVEARQYQHPDIRKTVDAMTAWDRQHAAEVAEYKRLRAKFENSEPV